MIIKIKGKKYRITKLYNIIGWIVFCIGSFIFSYCFFMEALN